MFVIKDEQGHSQVWAPHSGNTLRAQGRISKILNTLPPHSRVLELGCGHGDLTLALLDCGHDVTAIDRSQKMLEATAKKCQSHQRLSLHQADLALYLEKEVTHYDAIVGMGILHHVSQDLPSILPRMAHCLKKDGRGLFWEPNRANPLVKFIFGTSLGRRWFSLEEKEEAFTKEEIESLLRPLFPQVRVAPQDWAYPFTPPGLLKRLRTLETMAPDFLRRRVSQSLWIEFSQSASLEAKTESPK